MCRPVNSGPGSSIYPVLTYHPCFLTSPPNTAPTPLQHHVNTQKVIAFKFFPYIADPWSKLDFVVVVESLISTVLSFVGVESDGGAIKLLRLVRVLRTLRSVRRFPALMHVVSFYVQLTTRRSKTLTASHHPSHRNL